MTKNISEINVLFKMFKRAWLNGETSPSSLKTAPSNPFYLLAHNLCQEHTMRTLLYAARKVRDACDAVENLSYCDDPRTRRNHDSSYTEAAMVAMIELALTTKILDKDIPTTDEGWVFLIKHIVHPLTSSAEYYCQYPDGLPDFVAGAFKVVSSKNNASVRIEGGLNNIQPPINNVKVDINIVKEEEKGVPIDEFKRSVLEHHRVPVKPSGDATEKFLEALTGMSPENVNHVLRFIEVLRESPHI